MEAVQSQVQEIKRLVGIEKRKKKRIQIIDTAIYSTDV